MFVTIALGVTLLAGHAAAGGPDGGYAVREDATVRFIDRQLNLVQLDDGTEVYTTDARMLQNIQEGMRVTVDFVYDGDRNELNSIEPATPPTPSTFAN
jgi:hypothetical protein